MTAASSPTSVFSSHSSRSTSRWFVGSSRSSRSGSPASARASDARVSSPPENVVQLPVELGRPRTRARAASPASSRASRSRRRARAGPAPPSTARIVSSPWSPAAIADSSRRSSSSSSIRSRAPDSAYSRSDSPSSSGGRWSCSATRVPLSKTSCPPSTPVSPASIRSSVVLPAPFGPESASRSRRSTLNETPSKSSPPASSLRRLCPDHDGHAAATGYGFARPRAIASASIPNAASSSSGLPERGISRTARWRISALRPARPERASTGFAEAALGPVVLDDHEPARLAARRPRASRRRSA